MAVDGDQALFTVSGRATFARAGDLQAAFDSLLSRGLTRFSVDLAGCETLDSTFIGVLAALTRKLRQGSSDRRLELANLTERLTQQIASLGILPMFSVTRSTASATDFNDVAATAKDKADLTRTSLEAHRTLMAENDENVARFKDVAQYLAEELKRLNEPP